MGRSALGPMASLAGVGSGREVGAVTVDATPMVNDIDAVSDAAALDVSATPRATERTETVETATAAVTAEPQVPPAVEDDSAQSTAQMLAQVGLPPRTIEDVSGVSTAKAQLLARRSRAER